MADVATAPNPLNPSSFDQMLINKMSELKVPPAPDFSKYEKKMTESVGEQVKTANSIQDAVKVPPPAPPTLMDPPKPPEQQYSNPIDAFKGIMPVFAIFASMATRHPLKTAMTSMASAMEAFHNGETEKFKLEQENYKDKMDYSLNYNKKMLDSYKAIIDSRELDINEKTAALTTQMKIFDDWKGLAEFQAKGSSGLFEHFNAQMKMYEQMETAHTKMMNEMAKNTPQISEDDARHIAGRALLDSTALQKSLGYGDSVDKRYVTHEMVKLQKELGLSDGDVVAMQAGTKASSAALNNVTKQYTMISAFEQNMEKNMKVTESLMEKGKGTAAGPVINRWLQAGRVATGDPDVKAFNDSIRTVAGEYAKISSGSTGAAGASDTATARADDMISAIDSPAAVHKVFNDVMRPDARNRTSSLKDVLEAAKGNIATGGKTDVGGNTPKPTDDAIKYLKSNPDLKDDFDSYYGEGMAAKYIGEP